MIRNNETYAHIQNTRHLFQQFLVYMHTKIKVERLRYIKRNQKKLIAEEYIHFPYVIWNDGNIDDIGTMAIIPLSNTGSLQHMHDQH